MYRFKEELVFSGGELHFIAETKESLHFQKEKFNIKSRKITCCKLCVWTNKCPKNCPVGADSVLIKIKYFKLYKSWEKSINK